MKECICDQCQSGEYNPKDYVISEEEFRRLDEERPMGISGHLRVKDSALTVAECIESCIDALDELIITYNTSKDDTEKILKEYELKYPKKIKLYHYKPDIRLELCSTEGIQSEEEIEKILENASKNIHCLANYYNFGYVKINYLYYMKIDADQIYFSEKLKLVRRMLFISRKLGKSSINNKYVRYILGKFLNITRRLLKTNNLELLILRMIFTYPQNTILNLAGLNLFSDRKQCNIPIAGKEMKKILPTYLINGFVGDHVILIPRGKYKYLQCANEFYETIHWGKEYYWADIGFLWCHFGLVVNHNLSFDNADYESISLLKFSKLSYSELLKTDCFEIFHNISKHQFTLYKEELYKRIFSSFWDKDRKYITQQYYDHYISPIFNNYLKKSN